MINWYRVKNALQQNYPIPMECQMTIRSVLDFLYNEERMPLQEIVSLTDGEVVNVVTLWGKLKSLKIPTRARGGRHNFKEFTLKKEDFLNYSVKELSKIHKVSEETIYDRKKKLFGKDYEKNSMRDIQQSGRIFTSNKSVE
jgi:hypothetical protein